MTYDTDPEFERDHEETMTRVRRLRDETQALIDAETERMRRRHAELMKYVVPKLIAIALMIPLLIWLDRVSYKWLEDYVAREKARVHEQR